MFVDRGWFMFGWILVFMLHVYKKNELKLNHFSHFPGSGRDTAPIAVATQ